MKAHDVRQLRVCLGCQQLGDGRTMLTAVPQRLAPGHYHGPCLVPLLSMDELLAMPSAELRKLTLADLGPERTRAVLAVFDARGD